MLSKLISRAKTNRHNYVLGLILLITVVIMAMVSKRFMTLGTFQSIAFQFPEMGILTLSMMITMVSGGINLACIATANLSGIIMALMMKASFANGEDNILLMLIIALTGIVLSIVISMLNGVIIAYLKVPAILATLSTQLLVGGICLAITRGNIISGFPDSFQFIGNGQIFLVPFPLIIFIFCIFIMAIILKRLALGMQIYMYGSNVVATEFSGVNVKKMLIKVYALSGLFVGIASLLLTSRFNSAAAGYASSYLLQSVLIAVLGGVDPYGGSGRVSGMVLAVLLMQVVGSGINLLQVGQYLALALYGMILLVSVAIRAKSNG